MPFFSGFASALGQHLKETRADAAKRSEQTADREDRILQTLATSDDPEIASMAVTGLMSGVRGKPAKGMKGWLGEMEGNPALPTIRDLMAKGRPARAPVEPESMALPQKAAVEPGAPPMRDVEGMAAGGGARPSGPFGGTPSVDPSTGEVGQPAGGPRQLFLSPIERMRQEEEAKMSGRLNAYRWGMRHAQTQSERDLIMGAAGAPQRVVQNRPVTLELSDGTTTAGSYDPVARAYVDEGGNPLPNVVRIVTGNPNAGLHYITDKDGTVRVVQGTEEIGNLGAIGKPQQPPPPFSGTAQIANDQGGADVVRLPREGGPAVPVGAAPPNASTRDNAEQALAKGVVAAVDKVISESRTAGLPVQQGLRDRQIAIYNRKYGRQWTYEQWVAQANSVQPIAGTPATGGAGQPSGRSPNMIGAPTGPPGRPTAGKKPLPAGKTNPKDPFEIFQ